MLRFTRLSLCIILMLGVVAVSSKAADTKIILVKNGKANSTIVTAKNPTPAVKLKESTPELIECLIKQGADVNLLGKDGETPLAKAKRLGRTPLVAVLKKYGAK